MKDNKEIDKEEKIRRIIAVKNVEGIMGASGMYLDNEMKGYFCSFSFEICMCISKS